MTTVAYYHNMNNRNAGVFGWKPGDPLVYVASVEVALARDASRSDVTEFAFMYFNRIDDPEAEGVLALDANEAPSMSKGDVVFVRASDGTVTVYAVASMGFTDLYAEGLDYGVNIVPRIGSVRQTREDYVDPLTGELRETT